MHNVVKHNSASSYYASRNLLNDISKSMDWMWINKLAGKIANLTILDFLWGYIKDIPY